MKITDIGKSLKKLNVVREQEIFAVSFSFLRPHSIQFHFESLLEYNQQIIIIKSISEPNVLMRGQWYYQKESDRIYFLGSPWITNAEDLNRFNLKISDFALHDTLTDMIQILKSKDLLVDDIQSLVKDLKNQKAELQTSEDNLKITNTRLSVLIQNLSSAILVETESRKIALTNQFFCDLFKIPASPDLILGADCTSAAEQAKDLFKHPQKFVQDIDTILLNRETVLNQELEMVDGKVLERDFIPIYYNAIYQGHLWQYRDITQRKKSEADLISAKENAIHSKKEKEKFLANMSHEIRTPINIISGVTGLLLDTPLQKDQIEKAEIIKFSAENLLSLVNDILDFEKIESQKLKLEIEPFEIQNIIETTVKSLQYMADKKEITLKSFFDKEIPELVSGDQLRLKQILINLINNAIKFTEQGSVEIHVRVLDKNTSEVKLELEVKDTGIGIAEENISQIFKRFVQAQSDTSRKYGGTGLGLTIVKKLVDIHKGKIDVTSKLGFGTSFIIQLAYPVVKEKPENRNRLANAAIPDFSHLYILLVEDNPLNQMLTEGILQKTNIRIRKADNGKIATEILDQEIFDLVLMDLQMPEMDGFEAATYIRNYMNKQVGNIPIVALTANATVSEKERCFECGMDDVLTKPFTPNDLFTIISKHTSVNKVVHLDYLYSIYPDSSKLIKTVLEQYLIQMPVEIKKLQLVSEQGDLLSLSRQAHKMKPMFDYVGMKNESQICLQLENISTQPINQTEINTRIAILNKSSVQSYKEVESLLKTIE